MTDLSRPLRARLREEFVVSTPAVRSEQRSSDGTRKFVLELARRPADRIGVHPRHAVDDLLRLDPGRLRDVVRLLPDRQDGPGAQPHRRRDRRAGARAREGDRPARQAFNIVLMGMGEPLHNYDNTMKALRMLHEEHGLAISPRRITLSTVGIVPGIERLAQEPLMPNLAISLHATTEDQRTALVPPNRKYSLASLLEACRQVPAEEARADHVRVRDAGRRERLARRRAAAGEAAGRDEGQGEPDSAQPGAGHRRTRGPRTSASSASRRSSPTATSRCRCARAAAATSARPAVS